MNQEQIKSVLRTAIVIAGVATVTSGVVTKEQLAILGNDQTLTMMAEVIGIFITIGSGLWGVLTHRKTNAVAVVAAMPEVAQVQTTRTPEGIILANTVGSTPQATVTVAPHS